jgi:3-polyprenyl-4-hydroxybenzoate decarboxylase
MSHSEEGENYWPGYVDALTSMVQVLAFVMMMLAMAVFVLSQSVSKNAVEAIAKAVNADIKPNADVKQMTQAVLDKLQSLASADPASETKKAADSTVEKPAARPANPADSASDSSAEKIVGMRVGGARTRGEQALTQPPPDAPRITIGFQERGFRIETERAQSLAKFISENNVVERAQAVVINAYAYSGDGALSEARRLAYYRAMMARKQLIDEKVRPETIQISVKDTADKDKGSTVEMITAGGAAR